MSPLLLSTAYLPPIEYFTVIKGNNHLNIERFENYQKQSYRNRCRISGPNGINELSIPVDKKGLIKILVKDIRISYEEPWQKVHWRTILAAYGNSPYFFYYHDDLEPFYQKRFDYLLDFNTTLLTTILKWMKMEVKVDFTANFLPLNNDPGDYRYSIHPKRNMIVQPKPYQQVFTERYGFIPRLSIIDLIFNEGPSGIDYM